MLFVLTIISTCAVQAQTFSVIHTFTGGGDGANPAAGLTLDGGGHLYGTTYFGGHDRGNCTGTGCGTVYKLSYKSEWIFTRLYPFTGTGDGSNPNSKVVIGSDATLYGSTDLGNNVYNLKPPPTSPPSANASWTIRLVYQFGSVGDGNHPRGSLAFAAGRTIYGTTYSGGGNWNLCGGTGCGRVYELTPSEGGWTETPLYDFTGQADGSYPAGGVIFDHSGNLYGTASQGGPSQFGVVFELTNSSGWQENTLYGFQGGSDGAFPLAGLIFDQSGNLYGATSSGGAANGGTVFSLTLVSGNWTSNLLSSLDGSSGSTGPMNSLIMDSAGNLYGTTYSDGAFGFGNVFELTLSGGNWTYTSLYDFTGGSDGAYPVGGVTLDANGNLFGTTYAGGSTGSFCDVNFSHQCGVVFEITP